MQAAAVRTPDAQPEARLILPPSRFTMGSRVWTIRTPSQPIGSGSFGEVHHVLSDTNQSYALKCEPVVSVHAPQIANEVAALDMLASKYAGTMTLLPFPACIAYGPVSDAFNGFVMALYGDSIEAVYDAGGRVSFAHNVVVHVGKQLLRALHLAHDAGLVHRDLKPENILLAASAKDLSSDLYLVDWGLSARFGRREPAPPPNYTRCSKSLSDNSNAVRKHCTTNLNSTHNFLAVVGTSRYASIGAHAGRSQIPSDDVESALYLVRPRPPSSQLPRA